MGSKLGDPGLPLDSIEGHVALKVFKKKPEQSVFRRITPIACILIWAGICKHEPCELILIRKDLVPMFCHHCGNRVLPHHSFCPSCGERQVFGYLNMDKGKTPESRLRPIDFKDLFQKIESTLKRQSSLSNEEFEKHFGSFKTICYNTNLTSNIEL